MAGNAWTGQQEPQEKGTAWHTRPQGPQGNTRRYRIKREEGRRRQAGRCAGTQCQEQMSNSGNNCKGNTIKGTRLIINAGRIEYAEVQWDKKATGR